MHKKSEATLTEVESSPDLYSESRLESVMEGSEIESQMTRGKNTESLVQSSFLESISFEDSNDEVAIILKQRLNTHLMELQREIYDSINYENISKFKDLGGCLQVSLDFKIELAKGKMFTPLEIATVKGNKELVEAVL